MIMIIMQSYKYGMLLLLVIVWQVVSAPHQSLQVPNTQCYFHYSTSTNQQFSFHYCEYPSQRISSWRRCIQTCCPHTSLSEPALATIQHCVQQEQEGISKLYIVLFIFGGAIGLSCCCCLAKALCDKISSWRSAKIADNKFRPPEQIREVDWIQQKEVSRMIQTIKWSPHAKADKTLTQQGRCCICLDENCTAQLFCGHTYHPKCIGDWFKKNETCPFCRKQGLRGVKVYCRGCKWMYMVCTNGLIKGYARDIPTSCPKCKSHPKKSRKGSEQTFIQDSRIMFNINGSSQNPTKEETAGKQDSSLN